MTKATTRLSLFVALPLDVDELCSRALSFGGEPARILRTPDPVTAKLVVGVMRPSLVVLSSAVSTRARVRIEEAARDAGVRTVTIPDRASEMLAERLVRSAALMAFESAERLTAT